MEFKFKFRDKSIEDKVEDVNWLMDISKLIGKIEAYQELINDPVFNLVSIKDTKEKLEDELDELLSSEH